MPAAAPHRRRLAPPPRHVGLPTRTPTAPGKPRRQLRRSSGFTGRDAATAELDHARSLLDLAATNHARVEIADLLKAMQAGPPLPDRDTIARRVKAGVPRSASTPPPANTSTMWFTGGAGSPNTPCAATPTTSAST